MKQALFISAQWIGLLGATFLFANQTTAQLTENFDNITSLPAAGWVQQNNSSPIGTSSWFQGNPDAFPAFNGATNAYIGANFNNTAGAGTISNWLITPNLTLKNGDVITFYTRTSSDNMWADRLQVRMSTNGASANVGTTALTIGDFTTLLLEINPNLQLSVYPMVWTQFSVTISGLATPTSGRIAFRYFVTSGGPSGTNSDYIGIDNFVHTPYVCPTLNVSPASLNQAYAGLPFNQSFSQSGGLGNVTYAVSAGALPEGLNLLPNGTLSGTPTETGSFNFSITVTDASSCEGTQAYPMEVLCNPNGAALNNLPTLCSNNELINLNQGIPAGGTYSGTGVAANQFDPSVGTQTIEYTVTDDYGCIQNASGIINVNTAPSVALTSFDPLCFNQPPIVLNGGTPAGGVYSGTSVSGGIFTPNAVGEFTITYTYTDGNNCTNSASEPLLVEVCGSLNHFGENIITLHPNPSTGVFFIDLGSNNNDLLYIHVRNTSGQLVQTVRITDIQQQAGLPFQMDLSNLNSGIYVLEFIGTNNNGFARVMLER